MNERATGNGYGERPGDVDVQQPWRGTFFYDGDCELCRASARIWGPRIAPRGFVFRPLQGDAAREKLGLAFGEVPEEMKLLTRDGQVLGGVDGLLYAARRIWWAWPLWVVAHVPGVKALLRAGYRWVARHRHCLPGACRLSKG